LRKGSMIIAAGRMALVFVVWAVIVVGSVFLSIWLVLQGVMIYESLLVFFFLTVVSGTVGFVVYSNLFKKSKGLSHGSQNEWILLITILAAAFATGAAFQSVSTINAQTVSNSTCAKPAGLNVTSPNCIQIETTTQTQGPFTYLGQIGVWMVVLASIGALVFGILYLVLRLGLANGS